MARHPYRLEPRGKKGILWIRFTAPNGREVFRSSGTVDRDLATEWASKIHAEQYRVARLGEKPRRLWTEAVVAWFEDHKSKRSIKKDQHNLKWLSPYLGHLHLDEINADVLALVSTQRKGEPKNKRRRQDGSTFTDEPTSQSTVDKMMALIRSILRDAQRRGWSDSVPTIRIKEADGAEDYRWLTQNEAVRLHDELADHLRPPFLFALATGWREQNVLRLRWEQVDMERRVAWIKGRQAKGKKAIGAPLNRNAMDILTEQRAKRVAGNPWVFPSGSEKDSAPYVRASNTGWYAAQRRARIEPLAWHDLRHTWASWHVMAGTSLRSLMELGGWRSYQSVLRYAHLSPEHLAGDAERIEKVARKLHGRSA
ncbi:integrase [Stenotrophomonas rhizophila]|nr:integrase [Stenotrophomonas rhizophila]